MGEDKAFLPIDGIPMAKRVAAAFRKAGCSEIYLVGKKRGLASLEEKVLLDSSGLHHPLVGMAAALYHCETPWALVGPCDLPRLTEEHARALLSGPFPCFATDGEHAQPLLGIFPRQWAERASIMSRNGGSARGFSEGCHAVTLPSEALLNANRPSQLPRSMR